MTDAIVIGAGPAGLMAAEMLADGGHSVLFVDAKPSVGRKFLMAGKSGLNLTKSEPDTDFMAAFGTASDWLHPALTAFGPKQVQDWAHGLDQPTFIGSTNRVFPKSMKASPLLRNWLARLLQKPVTLKTRWRWTSWQDGVFSFETPDGPQNITPKTTVLALGGASWSRLGSDGAWVDLLKAQGIPITPFQPSNMGITVPWSQHMTDHFGKPLKNIGLHIGDKHGLGECVLSKTGLEGSLIYQFSAAFRAGTPLALDLLPDQTLAALQSRIAKLPTKTSRANILRKALRLDPVKAALVNECARSAVNADLATVVKTLPIPYSGTAPLDGAISVAGGVPATALTPEYMLKSHSGVFCAGEMLDWEAPTGGYLITACLATGRAAGQAAVKFLAQRV